MFPDNLSISNEYNTSYRVGIFIHLHKTIKTCKNIDLVDNNILVFEFINRLGRKRRQELVQEPLEDQQLSIGDYGYATAWDKSDEKNMDQEFEAIREGKLSPETFEDKLNRYYNDQSVHFHRSGDKFEPLQQGRSEEQVSHEGTARIVELMTGRSNRYFTHLASGTGTGGESDSWNRLQNENWRVSLFVDGFAEAQGPRAIFCEVLFFLS
jgi:hypothetical protein